MRPSGQRRRTLGTSVSNLESHKSGHRSGPKDHEDQEAPAPPRRQRWRRSSQSFAMPLVGVGPPPDRERTVRLPQGRRLAGDLDGIAQQRCGADLGAHRAGRLDERHDGRRRVDDRTSREPGVRRSARDGPLVHEEVARPRARIATAATSRRRRQQRSTRRRRSSRRRRRWRRRRQVEATTTTATEEPTTTTTPGPTTTVDVHDHEPRPDDHGGRRRRLDVHDRGDADCGHPGVGTVSWRSSPG